MITNMPIIISHINTPIHSSLHKLYSETFFVLTFVSNS